MTSYTMPTTEQSAEIRARIEATLRANGIDPAHVEDRYELESGDRGSYLHIQVHLPLTPEQAAAIVNGPG